MLIQAKARLADPERRRPHEKTFIFLHRPLSPAPMIEGDRALRHAAKQDALACALSPGFGDVRSSRRATRG